MVTLVTAAPGRCSSGSEFGDQMCKTPLCLASTRAVLGSLSARTGTATEHQSCELRTLTVSSNRWAPYAHMCLSACCTKYTELPSLAERRNIALRALLRRLIACAVPAPFAATGPPAGDRLRYLQKSLFLIAKPLRRIGCGSG
jgi:hypothetical protein